MPRQTIAAKSGYHNQLQKTLTRSKEVHITDSYYSMYATKAGLGFSRDPACFVDFFFASAKQILCFSAGSAYCIGLVRRAMKQFFLKALPVCRVFGRKTAKHEKTMQKGGKNIYKQRKIRKEG